MSDTQKLRLDLPLVLPDIHGTDDPCVKRLQDKLAGRPGIDEAHVTGVERASPSYACTTTPTSSRWAGCVSCSSRKG